MRTETKKAAGYLLALLFLGTVYLNVYRGYTQSLTVDEALTYNNFVMPPLSESFSHYDANNHVLNTLLSKLVVRLFGPSEIVLRLSSILAGALYLFIAWQLMQVICATVVEAAIGFAALAANPIVLDYLSAARGYSLGLAFQFVALYLMTLVLIDKSSKKTRNIAIGVALALSATGNLIFGIPNCILFAAFIALHWSTLPKPAARRLLPTFAEIAVPGSLLFALIMYVPLRHANASNFYIGEQSFQRSATILLVRSFNYPSVHWAERFSNPLGKLTGPAILVALFLLFVIVLLRRRSVLGNAALLAPLTLLGSLSALLLLHLLIGLPFPYERTGLYFIPLVTLTILEAAAAGLRMARLRIPAAFLYFYLVCVIGQYLLELKTDRYEEWAGDAGTKRVVKLLASMNNQADRQKRLAVSWEFENSVNYYRKMLDLHWLAPVDRTDPHTPGFDYYYLEPEDSAIISGLQLNVLYTDSVSHAVLAAPR